MKKFLIFIFLISSFFLFAGKTIPDTFFGLHMHKYLKSNDKPWPSVPFRVWRLWDTGICWPEIQPENKNSWDFTLIDKAVAIAEAQNVELVINIGLSPRWAAARPKNKSGYGENLTASEPKDIEDWKRYVKTLARRYKGKIKYWEMWNEPDMLLFYTGSVKKMVELVKEAYIILKEADPENKIISPPVTGYLPMLPWLRSFLESGGKDYIDIIGTHFYVWFKSDSPEVLIPRIEMIKSYAKDNGISDKPIWDTECGFKQANVTDKKLMAGYIARLAVVQWYYGIERVMFYSWDNKVIIRMIDPEYKTENEAGIAFRETQKWLIGSEINDLVQVGNNIWIARLKRNGFEARMIWHSNDKSPESFIKYEIPKEWNYLVEQRDLTGGKNTIAVDRNISIGVSPVILYDKGFFD